MWVTRKNIAFAIAGLAGLLVLTGLGLFLLLDPNAHKERFEAAASRASGLEVRIAGPLALRLSPGLHLVLEDLQVRNHGADVLRAKEANVGISWMTLLGQDPQIRHVVLKQAALTIERDRNGRFNFQKQATVAGESVPEKDLPDLSLSGAHITYVDQRFGKSFEGRDCRVDVRDLRQAGGPRPNFISRLTFSADFACGAARRDDVVVADFKTAVDAKNGIVELKPLTAMMFGAKGSGSVRADYTHAAPAYQVVYALPQFPVEELLRSMQLKAVASGRMDLSVKLAMQGKSPKELQQTLKGTVSLRGKGLTYSGGDLDQTFARFESSQNFNLFDVGAVFLAGPLGLLVTKGYDFATISQGGQGSSDIRVLVSEWNIDRGVARAEDVAMATKENRMALQGGIDWANDRFDDVTLALVDARGCVKVQQKIHGTLQRPVVEKPGLIQALTGPAVRLLKKGGEMLGADQCEVFYAGSVAAPKPDR